MNVLITGGAGFIGSHLARRLFAEKCTVTILDNFSPQIHGTKAALPPDLEFRVRLIKGDVRNREEFFQALEGQEVVVHLAAETGTGQSMYEIERYTSVNILGTAVLADFLVNHHRSTVKKVILASSRGVYGEGKYRCGAHGVVYPEIRTKKNLLAGMYEPLCPVCGATCAMMPTDEASVIHPSSYYGLTKQVQEQMLKMFSRSLNLSAIALRYQNVYGPGQSLKNPYTGTLAIFSNLARANQPIQVFEDGKESRDFVYIDDVVEATWLCIRSDAVAGTEALNIGSGVATTIEQTAKEIKDYFNSKSTITVTGAFREGDIRHNVADISRIAALLDYRPRWKFKDGIRSFLSWVESQELERSSYEQSLKEMKQKGLLHG